MAVLATTQLDPFTIEIIKDALNAIGDDGISSDPICCRVRVTVTDDAFICDFTGTAPETRGPVNCSWTGLNSAVRMVFKALTDPHLPANEGCFRAMAIVCPE